MAFVRNSIERRGLAQGTRFEVTQRLDALAAEGITATGDQVRVLCKHVHTYRTL